MPANLTPVGLSFSEGHTARRGLALWTWSVLVISDAVFLTRRSTGSFSSAAPEFLVVFSTAVVAILSWFAWLLYSKTKSSEPSTTHRVVSLGVSLAITLGWIAAVSANASPQTLGMLTGVMLVQLMSAVSIGFGTEIVFDAISMTQTETYGQALRRGRETRAEQGRETRAEQATRAEQPLDSQILLDPIDSFDVNDAEEESVDEGEEFHSDEDESQTLWLSRRTEGELELVEGWVRVTFAAGQRETVVHVAFCPPFGSSPEIETEDLDGVGLELRVAAAFPFGARLSVRRADSIDEEQSQRVGFAAQARIASRAA